MQYEGFLRERRVIDMNINQIRYFLAIVKTDNFSNAAFDCYISQSSISKQIKALEDELGVILFTREHSKIKLTDAGKTFNKYAKTYFEYYQDMLVSLEYYQNCKQAIIRLGSIPIVSSYGIANKIALFTKQFATNNICIDMYESAQFDVVNAIKNDVVDLCFLRLEFLENIELYDIILFAMDSIVLVCHKDNPLATKTNVSLPEVANHPLMILDPHSSINRIIRDEFDKLNLPLKIQCVTTRHKILMEILSTNSAITLLPQNLVDLSLFPNLKTIPLETPIYSQVALVKLKSKKLNKITTNFWKFWQEHYELDKT